MSIPLSVGAVLAVLVAGAHSYLGERYILTRLFRRQDLPKIRGSSQFTKDTLRFAWHLTSVAWIGCAALLASLASAPRGNLQTRILSGTFAFSGVVTLVGSRGRHLAWVVFFAIAALAWYGSW